MPIALVSDSLTLRIRCLPIVRAVLTRGHSSTNTGVEVLLKDLVEDHFDPLILKFHCNVVRGNHRTLRGFCALL